ncbi:ABC transporter permease [Methylobacterium gossipiicola]|uniref:Nucleoside ABC transporter membrane protein n=1 Tax=Methylobacterium gossipiicola TaxID=582675 RepID=A0A1I2XFY4_9HYPH|nr:ABC transporter permease [Methylobacterium gossipiicola]SFH12345.1 nucleoside ABC transporter membrane protein [Methylobacterium gossipiicola]
MDAPSETAPQPARDGAAAARAIPPAHPSRRRLGRLSVGVRQHASARLQGAVLAGGLLTGLACAAAILVAAGIGPADLVQEFVVAIVTSPESAAAVLVQGAPLAIVGLAAALAFRVRFWNIGIEGQMIAGAIAATVVALHDIGPPALRLPLMLAAAALGGSAWILGPVLLRLRIGLNEIISTLLLNYVAFNALLHLLYGPWRDPENNFPNSQLYEPSEQLAELGWQNLTWALPLAGVLLLGGWWLLSISRFGFLTRIAEANPRMGEAQGLPMTRVILAATLASGALAGIAGFMICAGAEHRLTQSFASGYGFSGILIAFLARNSAPGVLAVALFVGTLFVAGQSLQVFYQIPASAVQLLQAVIVLCVAASDFFIRHRLRWLR